MRYDFAAMLDYKIIIFPHNSNNTEKNVSPKNVNNLRIQIDANILDMQIFQELILHFGCIFYYYYNNENIRLQ